MAERRYPERPLVGVGAVLFTPDLEWVLLVRRGSPPSQGLWSIPGGMVELGESVEGACAREVQEETGLLPKLATLARVVERVLNDAQGQIEYHFIIIDLWGTASGTPRASSDAAAAEWVLLDEVQKRRRTRGLWETIQRAHALARGEAAPSPVLLHIASQTE